MFTPQALDPAWLDLVDAVACEALGPADRRGPALVEDVRALSQLYTRGREALADQGRHLAARLRFFLPRDLPKIEGPLADLHRQGALPPGPRWRVLDLGSGPGTTSLGLAAAARRLGVQRLDLTALDLHAPSLQLMRALVPAAEAAGLVAPTALDARAEDLLDAALEGPYDLVLMGLSLNELPEGRRLALVRRLLAHTAPHGALILLEPALREVSRALQRLRDALVALDDGPTLRAPCTHRGPCPLLARERDWCHGELPLALPEPLAALARAAGLRGEGLSASWLVVSPGPVPPHAENVWRVVGGPVVSKGRCDWTLCGPGGLVGLGRLDRHAGPDDPLQGARRGSLLAFDAPPEGPRLRADRVGLRRLR